MEKIIKLKKPFLIAEIGINHNGDIRLAKKLIDLSKKYNFDCVKFQKRDLDLCIPKYMRLIKKETPWGVMDYIKYKRKIEFNRKDYDEINAYCKKKKIKWFASAWDANSQKFLKKYKCKYNKIASAMITNLDFIKQVALERKKTFISTGMTNLKDIDKAVKIFKSAKCPFVLMHCVSTYPCPEENLNLNMIRTLHNRYKCEVGYSGHESSVSPSVTAWFLGANSIERHITLNRSMWGTDQSASLGEDGIRLLTITLSKTSSMLGDGKKKFSKEEKKISDKLRYWKTK